MWYNEAESTARLLNRHLRRCACCFFTMTILAFETKKSVSLWLFYFPAWLIDLVL